MKLAILRMSPEVFRELLQLPDGALLRGVSTNMNEYCVLELLVEGVGWETAEGNKIMIAPSAKITDGVIDWGLPNAD